MKTGTTYLQQLLIQNRQALADRGYLLPGKTWADQVRAAHDVVGHHRERGVRQRAAGAWQRLVGEMLDHDGAASVFSVEFLGFAGPRVARRVAADLEPAEVHVVLTVRDTCEVLPGLWQTHCANGGTASWSNFAGSARLGALKGPATPLLGQGARLFRRALDVPRMLDAWAPVVPEERLHVVTVPRPGAPREVLWERFASVLRLDPAVAGNPPKGHNPSLGYASADLMRRLNAQLGRLPRERYNPTLKHVLAEEVLAARAGSEERAWLDEASQKFALRWNLRTRAALESSKGRLVGDLDDLPTEACGRAAAPITEPKETDLLEAAETALAGMAGVVRRRCTRLRNRRATGLPDTVVLEAADRRPVWEESDDPVAAAVRDLADTCRTAIALQDQLAGLRT